MIPRLSILEIEYQYNRNKKNIRSKNAKVEDSNKAVRNSFSDMYEILNIKTEDGIIPLIDTFLIDTQ